MRVEDILYENSVNGTPIFKHPIFKNIPQNIGEVIYCDSSNPKVSPDSKEVTRKKVILSIVIPAAIAVFCWFVFDESPIFDTIVSIIMVIICMVSVNNCLSFDGQDYFVGRLGATILSFEKSRDNIINEKTILFEEVGDIVTSETKKYKNFSYNGTEYYFVIFAHEKDGRRDILAKVEGVYYQEKPDDYYTDQIYRFWKTIETNWCKYKFEQLKSNFNEGKAIGFNIYTEKGFVNNYIVFQGNKIKIGEKFYDKTNIKRLGFSNGNLIIEDKNYSSTLFGLIKKGDKEEIPFSAIGNRELFLIFFQFFESTL